MPLPAYRHVFRLSLILTLLLTLGVAGSAAANQAAFPSEPLLVETHFGQTDPAAAEAAQRYLITSSLTAEERLPMLSFSAAEAPEQAICHFRRGADGVLYFVLGENGRPQPVDQPLFLQPGFPLPVDIIPVAGEQKDETNYELVRSSGGRTFKERYRLLRQTVDRNTASASGWLRLPVDQPLLLYTVSNSEGQVVLRQLWPEGGSWWYYEESQFRRSWRIR